MDTSFRKLIKFGKNSYVISLPKDWIQENKLTKGKVLYVSEKNNDLVVSLKEGPEKKDNVKVIELENKPLKHIKAEIMAAYLTNYNIVEIHGNSMRDKAGDIKDILHDLVGVEILEQTANKIVAKDLIDIKEISIQKMIRRLDLLLRGMMEDSINEMDKVHCKECGMCNSIDQRDKDVNRLHYLARRVIRNAMSDPRLARFFNISSVDLMASYVIISSLEKIGDQIKRITRTYKAFTISRKAIKSLKEIYTQLFDGYKEVMKAYYKRDVEVSFKTEINKAIVLDLNTFFLKHPEAATSQAIEYMKEIENNIRKIAREITFHEAS
ncbi:MAG: AbrB/MazE/SpoVT family DNA-binding domain-containing protein [archaeon]